jgi:hypothetical protein
MKKSDKLSRKCKRSRWGLSVRAYSFGNLRLRSDIIKSVRANDRLYSSTEKLLIMVVSLQLVWWGQNCRYHLKKIKVLMIITSSMTINWVWVCWEQGKLRMSSVQGLHFRTKKLNKWEYSRWLQVWWYLDRDWVCQKQHRKSFKFKIYRKLLKIMWDYKNLWVSKSQI